MAGPQPKTAVKGLIRVSLVLSCVLFLSFVIDVLLDKAHAALGWTLSVGLSDVGSFLTLLSAAFFFIVAALLREYQNRNDHAPSGPDRIVNQP
jgi:hypothetical protein